MASNGEISGLEALAIEPFDERLKCEVGLYPLKASAPSTLQVDLGSFCNLKCRHCHVSAGPDRTDKVMTRSTMESCLEAVAGNASISTIDITGGAPEMHPDFKWFVAEAVKVAKKVMVRTNLTLMNNKAACDDIGEFLAARKVELVASLPYYRREETDRMRGEGVFKAVMESMKYLNSIGYGMDGSGLKLNLVYNPTGAFMAPSQSAIEADFRRELTRREGVSFNNLFVITNMPIGRFFDFLVESDNLMPYMERLASAFNPDSVEGLMCRTTLSVASDGTLYDCDFNRVLGLKSLLPDSTTDATIESFDGDTLDGRDILTAQHCYGCTAGAGSSCAGETT